MTNHLTKTDFEYPLDTEYLMRKRKSLKRSLESDDVERVNKNIAILGGSSTQHLTDILEVFLLSKGISGTFYQSDFGCYVEDSLFGEEKLAAFQPDIIIIHSSVMNLNHIDLTDGSRSNFELLLENEVSKYNSIWKSLERHNCPIIQNNFDLPQIRPLGNLCCSDYRGLTYFINKLNDHISKNVSENSSLFVHDINYLSAYVGLEKWFDQTLWYTSKYAISMNAMPHFAANISNIICSLLGVTKKCLVLDLDNTCWGGVIGDDGIEGIRLGPEDALSEAFLGFQKYVKNLNNLGVSLAVCSKNEEKVAKSGFTHPSSVLHYNDFASFKANWGPKNINLVDIASEINIGLDSMVFIDDNPAEREIAASVKELSVPDIGDDITNYIKHLDRNGFFERSFLSEDDSNRKDYYAGNKKRSSHAQSFVDYDVYLKDLAMTASIKKFDSSSLERVSQLAGKTNQFNLTTKRLNINEISLIASDDSYLTLYGTLTDKFGANGIISAIIGKTSGADIHIELWIMSCRVFKRGMEFAMFDRFVEKCKQNGVESIYGYYFKTAKNIIIKNLLADLGFTLHKRDDEDTVWHLQVKNYQPKNKFIESKYE
jgi:FkbH-like protein